MSRYTRTTSRERAAEIVAALMKAPRTVQDLAFALDANLKQERTFDRLRVWLAEFHRSGVVYVKGYRRAKTGGRRRPVFALQPSLFAERDAHRDTEA